MRILLRTPAFDSLRQRIGTELRPRGHEVSVEFDISDSVAEDATPSGCAPRAGLKTAIGTAR